MPRVLVVDDEPGVRESLRMLLKDDCQVAAAASVDEALDSLRREPADLVLLDLVMPGRSGLELLGELREQDDAPPVVVLTAARGVSTAVEAMKQGAADYVSKPFEVDALRIKVAQMLEKRALEREVVRLREQVERRERLGEMLGRSEAMQEVFHTLRRVARSKTGVLIQGESGTGKELAARAVHELSPRSQGPFVAVNCAAIPENLMESELFGHERGAFTDAVERRIGKFEAAAGGTLFLDEIGELPIGLQAKLLRALEDLRIERVGASQAIEVDARVVAATNRDLERDVGEGRFRADLFYRINVVPIQLPPLRERRADVRPLAEHFLRRAREEAGQGPSRIAGPALSALEGAPWPGNVRELRNAIEHAVALATGDAVELDDLPQPVVRAARLEALGDGVRSGRVTLEDAVGDFERALLLEALERNGWNQTHAAQQLRITRRVLKLKMDRHQLRPPS